MSDLQPVYFKISGQLLEEVERSATQRGISAVDVLERAIALAVYLDSRTEEGCKIWVEEAPGSLRELLF